MTLPLALGPLSKLRALVLEDAFLIAYEAEQALFELGAASVVIAQDIVQAFEALDQDDRIDFAVLDISLSDGDSLEFARRLNELGVPFVFTSGYSKPAEVTAVFPDVPYLEKPYQFDGLKKIVSDLLSERVAPND